MSHNVTYEKLENQLSTTITTSINSRIDNNIYDQIMFGNRYDINNAEAGDVTQVLHTTTMIPHYVDSFEKNYVHWDATQFVYCPNLTSITFHMNANTETWAHDSVICPQLRELKLSDYANACMFRSQLFASGTYHDIYTINFDKLSNITGHLFVTNSYCYLVGPYTNSPRPEDPPYKFTQFLAPKLQSIPDNVHVLCSGLMENVEEVDLSSFAKSKIDQLITIENWYGPISIKLGCRVKFSDGVLVWNGSEWVDEN